MTYQSLRDFLKLIPAGKITIQELKEHFAKAIASKEALKAEISKLYKVVDLKRKFLYYRSSKKADLVDNYYQQLIGSFRITSGMLSYSMSESYEQALRRVIESQTQEQLDQYAKDQKAKKAAFEKALTNPETIEEFKQFVRYKGADALSPDQEAQYEALIADRTLQEQAKQAKTKAAVKRVELKDIEFSLQQTTHTKKGHDLWVVQLSQRVEKDKYRELNSKAKMLGGYYSSYAKGGAIPGFQFKTAEAAQQFMSLKEGNVDRAEKVAQKAAKKQSSVSERLLEMADNWEEKGREKLTADRKTNTARRARIAAGVEADAEAKIYVAKVLRSIAKALQNKEIKYLSRIDSAVQLDTLRNILFRANYNRMRKQEVPYNEWKADFDQDIEFVTYPYPSYHWERLRRLANELAAIRGQKMRAKRLYQAAVSVKKGQWMVSFKRDAIADIRAIIPIVKSKVDREWLKNGLEQYDRIQRMGLTNLPTLKTALREYHQYAQVSTLSPEEERAKLIKKLERQFVGKKIPGFFPTPRPLVIRMLSLADIDADDTLLEPSAGLGHIADIISEKHPDNALTLIEDYFDLAEALKEKGYEVIKTDFLQYQEKRFDKIIMNPPFERLQDIDHVRHAYSLLKPGGRLVAIMAGNKGEGSTRQKIKDFRNWLEEIGAYTEENPEGAFKSAFRSTGVRTIMVAIDKEEGQAEPPKSIPAEKPQKPAKTQDQAPWQMRLKEYVYLRGDGYALAEKYYTDFVDHVSHWSGDWPVDKRTGGTWNIDKAITLRYIKDHRASVLAALQEGKPVSKAVLQDQMLEDNPVIWIKISDIKLDEQRFQNRASLNQAIVDEIAENFDPNQFDPIVIWKDPKDGKTYLLAGHHRLAGVKKAGKYRISARWFQGSQKEAITYAKELSNANRTLETPLERAKLYRQKIQQGAALKEVSQQAKKLEGKNWRYIVNLAHLNPDGKTVNALIALADNSDKLTQQNLEKIADWIGEARRQFEVLTQAHENEMYDFLLEQFQAKKPSISRKDTWIERIRALVQTLDFKPTQALNLKRIQHKTKGESEYEAQMKELDSQIKVLESKKQELKDRFNTPSHPQYVSPEQADYSTLQKEADQQTQNLNEQLQALRKQKLALAQQKGKMVKGGLAQMDLFSATVKQVEKEVDQIRLRQAKPENKKKSADELWDTYEQAYTEKDYIQIIRTKLNRARKDGVQVSEVEIIQLGIMIRPLVQSYRGALTDILSTNKRVLAPNLNNLLRWAQQPGRYDLVGVDIAGGAKPTILARKVKRARILNLLGIK